LIPFGGFWQAICKAVASVLQPIKTHSNQAVGFVMGNTDTGAMVSAMKETTLLEAEKIKAFRDSVTAPGCPLRYRPCIIHGPNDGYLVVELGFAQANDFAIVK
jgi:hypothetical protein